MSDVIEVNFNETILCPFRSNTTIKQSVDEIGVPYQTQSVSYPECHYASCPFYNPEGKGAREKCDQAAILLAKISM